MVIRGAALITKFTKLHPQARKPFARFITIVENAGWKHLADVRETFSSAVDYVPPSDTYVFNIGGNKYRLFAFIAFEDQILAIERVLTHEKYGREEF